MAEHSIKNTLETVAEYIGEEVKDALDEKEDVFRMDTMPTASADWSGKTVQYTGATILNSYIHNYFYECRQVPESDPAEYEWVASEVQASAGISQQDLATAEDVQAVKDTIDLMYGFDVLAHDEDVQAVKDIIDQINDFIPYYV